MRKLSLNKDLVVKLNETQMSSIKGGETIKSWLKTCYTVATNDGQTISLI